MDTTYNNKHGSRINHPDTDNQKKSDESLTPPCKVPHNSFQIPLELLLMVCEHSQRRTTPHSSTKTVGLDD